jgi:hypothetical protein
MASAQILRESQRQVKVGRLANPLERSVLWQRIACAYETEKAARYYDPSSVC